MRGPKHLYLNAGGVSVSVSPSARIRLRRFARALGALIGVCCGIAALSFIISAVIASGYLWWVLGLGAFAGWQLRRVRE